MPAQASIKTAHTCEPDARDAVRAFHAAVTQPDMALVVFFCSAAYNLDEVAAELREVFAGVHVVGCTTAGEIGPAGYRDHSITGASFGADAAVAVSGRFADLANFTTDAGQAKASELLEALREQQPDADGTNTFALLLIDGLSVREEPVARAVQSVFGSIPVMGGSAGDGVDFGSTYVYDQGEFHGNSAVAVLISTPLPIVAFQTQHFISRDQRVVVTGADPSQRLITELDGYPAAEAYARLIGTTAEHLDPARYAAHPMVVLVNGTEYVRGIQTVNPDGTLTLFGAIEEGVVLRAASAGDVIDNLNEAFDEVRAAIGDAQIIFGCDCILRKLEVQAGGLIDDVAEVLEANHVIGFSGYGEQYRGVHVNQTLSGVAIGGPAHV